MQQQNVMDSNLYSKNIFLVLTIIFLSISCKETDSEVNNSDHLFYGAWAMSSLNSVNYKDLNTYQNNYVSFKNDNTAYIPYVSFFERERKVKWSTFYIGKELFLKIESKKDSTFNDTFRVIIDKNKNTYTLKSDKNIIILGNIRRPL